ncbi:Uncharacterized methyltransferase C3B9.04, mitochondrial [Seminavis robusta]|uniref:Uncharacterized methyltransferase C3B9.04, mitochondrial n=1 Tax=Seminavis robusta TaxID=568900 RepID=A0A9N8HT78_9STRA|nr:Uncharacterized methyltransferase C3B9.04, mitochondrial [Seminavis robusta]|eukprot:Sro1543_g281170.1 Uncharacterized methyltransferase C3B9.04, mitochondrial (289) ;mRNA; r:18730-19596
MALSTFGRRAGLVVAGTGVYVGTSYLVYQYMTSGKADQEETQRLLSEQQEFSFVKNPSRNEKYSEIAARYDFMINNDERFMGMGVLRRCLLYYHARGTVLEMAAGTGRNCPYYPAGVDRVVLTDTSSEMLDQAKRKIGDLSSEPHKKKFAVLQADSGHLSFGDSTFDTVVDTFGLCSFNDPVAALKEMERVCKPDGKILLLEHGRSKSWQWVTKILDDNAERHAKNWGCVHNRDLDQILEKSGLVLDTVFTWHFGTTYYCVCRPNKQKSNNKSMASSNQTTTLPEQQQ